MKYVRNETVETKARILPPSTYVLQFDLSCTIKAVLHLRLGQDIKHQNKDLTYSQSAMELWSISRQTLLFQDPALSSLKPFRSKENISHSSSLREERIPPLLLLWSLPKSRKCCLGWLKKENPKQNPFLFRAEEQANVSELQSRFQGPFQH